MGLNKIKCERFFGYCTTFFIIIHSVQAIHAYSAFMGVGPFSIFS